MNQGSPSFNPNAAPFQPGIRYQQPQATQSNFPTNQFSAVNSAYDGASAGSRGGSSAATRPFRFDPFGYNHQQRNTSPVYQQQQPRPSFSPQRPQQQQQQQQFDSSSYYSSANNQQADRPYQPGRAFGSMQNGYVQQNSAQIVNNPASCSGFYQNNYQQNSANFVQDQPAKGGGFVGGGEVAFAGHPLSNNKMESFGSVLSGGEGEFGGEAPPQYTLSPDLLAKMQANPNRSSLFEIQIGLEQLIYESQEFETWASAIRDRLMSKDLGSDDLILASSIIVEMAVLVADCQYNFSRLCQFLSQTIQSFASDCLIPVLEEFFYNNSTLLDIDQTKNLLLFQAELYAKLEVEGSKSQALAVLVTEQINNLLKCDAASETVTTLLKAVVQALKLVGRFLENDQGPGVMNDIFQILNQFCCNSEALSESVKGQILALNQLRENQWGVTNLEQSNFANANTSSTNVMIIGPDGKPLSEEECAFLDENYDNYASSPAGSWNGALEEDEVLEDYEKFLQATAIRAAEKALEKISFDEEDEESALGSPKFAQASHSSSEQRQHPKEKK